MIKTSKLNITKKGEKWVCKLITKTVCEVDGVSYFMPNIEADSFPELLVELGNQNWVDILNKNE